MYTHTHTLSLSRSHTHTHTHTHSNCRHEDAYGTAVTRKHLCAGYDEGGPDACQNDSGGPLVCHRGGRWMVFGVVNSGIRCGHQRKYGVYARVVRYNRSVSLRPD